MDILLFKRNDEDIYELMESDFRILLSTALCQADICGLKLLKKVFVIIVKKEKYKLERKNAEFVLIKTHWHIERNISLLEKMV